MPTDLKNITGLFLITKDPRLQRGFAQIIQNLISTKSCIMSEWSRAAYDFSAFIKKCFRFFRNNRVDWNVSKAVLGFLLCRFNGKKFIPILIDPSFIVNKFLGSFTKTKEEQAKAKKGFFLLSAALPVRGRAVSFFQAVWKNSQISYLMYDSLNDILGIQLIKITNLIRPILAKAVLIMDRGFGYEYFLNKFIELKANYIVRVRDLKTYVTLVRNKKRYHLSELVERVRNEPILFKVLYKSKVPINVVIVKKGSSTWALATNLDNPKTVIELYKQRMKIEEAFKDWKSTGFNIEKMQIRDWNILHKMIWCVVIAHMILYLLGETIDKQHKKLFKKFIQYRHSLSYVQLAWKAWLFAMNDILPLFLTLKSTLLLRQEALV